MARYIREGESAWEKDAQHFDHEIIARKVILFVLSASRKLYGLLSMRYETVLADLPLSFPRNSEEIAACYWEDSARRAVVLMPNGRIAR